MDVREKAAQDAQQRYERDLAATRERRQAAFAKAHQQGLSLSGIARVVGLHRSRVAQIIKGE
jgi:DNA-directed RNA polymerase specialized sigma24 family protein